ncbi:hypothetical protein [Nitrosovibrio sp. Nv6]|uniref:hypothetical protein n=1 Tax=Nitrosovibrio sp. Nv6 TaxID=1855340 RepID=UPI0008BC8089|nr:hypothetical protein [Nitrosovibrio sp. Nv6]SEP04929.1 hypothetical protein SAMN05216316_1578 [Nitrosovibrio sp. Nv6]
MWTTIFRRGALEADFQSGNDYFSPFGVFGLRLIVSHVSVMKGGIARSWILACTIFFGIAAASPVQGDNAGKDTGSMPARPGSAAGAQPGQGNDTAGQKATAPEDGSSSPSQGAPDQTGSSSASRESGTCRQPIPDQEGFFRKVIGLLFAPDSCGPNRDVDTNISAGGAGGG